MNLSSRIQQVASDQTLTLKAALKIASDSGLSLAEIEGAALRLGIWPLRYSGHAPEITPADQLRLLESTVLIAGCGGLGSHCASCLARLGIGRLILVDPDRFDESNLNRQLFCTVDTLGQHKVKAAAAAISSINPAVSTETLTEAVEHAGRHVSHADAVLDCLDNARPRLDLAHMCKQSGIPLVHGAVSGTMGQIAVQTSTGGVIEHLYPCPDIPTESGSQLVFAVAAVAAMQCSEILKLLLDRPSPVQGTWAFLDIRELEVEAGP
jgi:molybdopterin/thiamine biosynthesis adenylyltransferase